MKLYLTYKENVTGGERLTEEQFSDREPAYTKVTFLGLFREPPKSKTFFPDPSVKEIEVSEDTGKASMVYLVIVRYRDGDTFGTSHGNWEVFRATEIEKEALSIKTDIESGAMEKRAEKEGRYLPWTGYFNSLEGVEVHAFRVGASSEILYH